MRIIFLLGLLGLLGLVGAACGNPSPGAPDAASRDAPAGDPDAPADASPDAAPSAVTIRLIGRASGPVTGTALFYDAAGALLERVVADGAGLARAVVPAGGSVTVVETGTPGLNGPPYFTTFVQVEPGDELLVGDLDPLFEPFESGSLALPPGPAASNEYQSSGRCGASFGATASPIPFNLFAGCPAGPRPVIVTARQPGTQIPTGYIFDPSVPFVAGGTATIDGDWQPPITFDVALTGLPAFTKPSLFVQRLYQGLLVFSEYNEIGFQNTGMFDAAYVQPSGGDGTMTWLGAVFSGAPNTSNYEILEYRDGTPNELTGDVSADLVALPSTPVALSGELAPGGPTGTNGMSWTMSGTSGFDGIVLRLMMESPSGGLVAWTIVAPPPSTTSPEVRVPPLPADFAAIWAQQMHFSSWVFVADTPAASYAEFRRDAEPQAFAHHWMFRPTAPRKIRLAIAVHQLF